MAKSSSQTGLGAGLVVGGGLNSTIERTRIAPARKCRSLSCVRIAVRCFISGAGNGRRCLRGAVLHAMRSGSTDQRRILCGIVTITGKFTPTRFAEIEALACHQEKALPRTWHPFPSLRREMDRLFDDFDVGFWLATPAVDVAENEKAFEITAELPGSTRKTSRLRSSMVPWRPQDRKPRRRKTRNNSYHLRERRFGSFERYFSVPDGVDEDKIEATFRKGVLTVTMPKKAEAQKAATKIEVKAA